MEVPFKIVSTLKCTPFPGFEPYDDESGADYFKRVTQSFEAWLDTCFSLEVEVLDKTSAPPNPAPTKKPPFPSH